MPFWSRSAHGFAQTVTGTGLCQDHLSGQEEQCWKHHAGHSPADALACLPLLCFPVLFYCLFGVCWGEPL